jgi:hypothetical protein
MEAMVRLIRLVQSQTSDMTNYLTISVIFPLTTVPTQLPVLDHRETSFNSESASESFIPIPLSFGH